MTTRLFWVIRRSSVWGVMCVLAIPASALELPVAPSTVDIVFYTLALTSIAFFSVGMIVTKQYHWLTYSVYGVAMIALIASLDGTLAYGFDGNRWLMSDAPLLIGAATAAFGFAHVAYRLEPGHWLYKTRRLQQGFALLMVALLPLYFAVPAVIPNLVPLYMTLNTGMLLMFMAQILPPITWTAFTPAQHRAAIAWPVTTAVVGVGGYLLHFLGSGFERDVLNLFNRVLFGMHLAHLLVFVCISVIEQMRRRVVAEQTAAEAARAAAEAALALEVSERDFERARALASNRSRQLASASHDLKQPIAALRQVVEMRAAENGQGDTQRLRDAVDYLDQLAGTYLTIGRRDLDASLRDQGEVEHDDHGRERVAVQVILDTIVALYQQEAHASGIRLERRAVGCDIIVHPLALTRVLSNLVANAIAHGQCSRILICARRRGSTVRIEIHDNGQGMTQTALENAKRMRATGEHSDGSGLGLSIVQHQADEQGWIFSLRSEPGRGTSGYLIVPLAAETTDAGHPYFVSNPQA